MAEEAANPPLTLWAAPSGDPMGDVVEAINVLRALAPHAVRFDLSADLYEELRKLATPTDRWLYGAYTVPSALAAQVVVHYDWPPGVMGVGWSDGTVESYQY